MSIVPRSLVVRRRVAFGVLVLVSMIACGETRERPNPSSGPVSPTSSGQPAADRSIEDFSAGDSLNASFAALHEVERVDPDALRAAALARLGSTDPDVRFAAVYALGVTAIDGPSADALVGLLESDRTSERLLAAAGLLPLGRTEAIPILIDGLDDGTVLAHRDPPKFVWESARALLLAFTSEDFGLAASTTADETAATKPAWEAWWAADGASLVYRATGHRYEAAP